MIFAAFEEDSANSVAPQPQHLGYYTAPQARYPTLQALPVSNGRYAPPAATGFAG